MWERSEAAPLNGDERVLRVLNLKQPACAPSVSTSLAFCRSELARLAALEPARS